MTQVGTFDGVTQMELVLGGTSKQAEVPITRPKCDQCGEINCPLIRPAQNKDCFVPKGDS